MRMFNPEWEAIRNSDLVSRTIELHFDLNGSEIPADHGFALHSAVLAAAPALAEIEDLAILPITGAPSGRNDMLVLNRRAKLILRVPTEQQNQALTLQGVTLALGSGLMLGRAKAKSLLPFATLYSALLDLNERDEVTFLAQASALLSAQDIPHGGLICGKQRTMSTPDGVRTGYSLMIHDVPPQQSLQLQETGLGRGRAWGCGVFVPHKSIKEVTFD